MSDVSRIHSLRYGINAALNSFGSVPAVMTAALHPRGPVPTLLPRTRTPIERPLATSDGRKLPRIHGGKDVGPIELPLEFKGVNDNTGAAVAAWEAKMEQGNLLVALMGAVATPTIGAKPTVAAGSSTAALEASSNALANLDIVAVLTSVGFEIRQITAGGGTTTLTPNTPFLGTPVETADIIRLGRWTASNTVTNHKGIWFDAEGESWRRRYKDCVGGGFVLNIPNTGAVEFDSTWLPTDWSDDAEADPAFAAPVAGSPVFSGSNQLIIASKALLMKNAKLTVSNGVQMRETSTGPNGVLGGVCADKSYVLECDCYLGNDTPTLGEFVDDSGTPSLDNILGSDGAAGAAITTRDVMFQAGGAVGACLFGRMPEADIRGETFSDGALTMARLRIVATGAIPAYLGVG